MPQVRYLGFPVGEATSDAARGDATLGQFLAIGDPLPVGTVVEIDGARQRITRVDEGAAPGFWILPAGGRVASQGTPVQVEAEHTDPSPPPIEMTAEPADTEEGTPEPIQEDGGRGKGKKRKPRKTVAGR